MYTKRYLFLIFIFAIFLTSFFVVFNEANANYVSENVNCVKHGSNIGCSHTLSSQGESSWRVEWSVNVNGFGAFGPKGGRVGLNTCLTYNGSMWNGSCWIGINPNNLNNNNPCGGSGLNQGGEIGENNGCFFNGGAENPDPALRYGNFEIFVDDAGMSGTVAVYGNPLPVPGCTDPNATNYNPSANTNDGSCQYFVNLNFNVNSTCGPVGGADVNISQNFGNGTYRSTDGNGFANFGVYQNTTINWSVSKSGYSSSPTSANGWNTGNGSTANVGLGNPPGVGNACPSSPNACGQTQSNGTTQCNGSCSSTPPANPAGYGNSCPSSANACGQTQSNGTWQCDGSCSSTPPGNPAGYGTACNSTNACGQSNSGTTQCDGTCSVSAPAVTIPGGNTYGAACSSAANACGQTQSNGTWQCDGSCSSTPPANTCSSTATISASPNPIIYSTSSVLTWSSINTVANSCSITGGPVVGGSASLPTSGSKSTANLTASTTYTVSCAGFNGSSVSDSTTVSVGAAPAMNYFRCNGVNTPGTCTIGYGGTAAITWSSSNTTNCSLVSTVPTDEGVGPSGTNNYAGITSNRDYSIECWNDTSGVHAPALPLPLRVVVSGPSVDIKANNSNGPITLDWNSSANLSWSSSNAGSCNASGDWSGSKVLNSSESTGNLTNPKTYNYTLTCSGNGSASDTVQVILNSPVPNNPANVAVTPPNYCVSGPAATVNWIYSDPSGSPQSAYQVQMDEQGSFQSPEYDSCVNQNTCASGNSSNSNFTGQGILQFNKTYKTRVRVWNGYGVVSGWTVVSGNYNTPPYAYPQTDFYWTANSLQNNPSPPLNKPVTFTDQTVFNGNPNGREWSWVFGDGGSSTTQNPSHTYSTEGSYYITLTATDNANQSCARTKGPLFIQKPIPKWREVAPR